MKTVYKHVAKDGTVLYVGSTGDLNQRTKQHKYSKTGGYKIQEDLDVVVYGYYEDDNQALIVEAALINKYRDTVANGPDPVKLIEAFNVETGEYFFGALKEFCELKGLNEHSVSNPAHLRDNGKIMIESWLPVPVEHEDSLEKRYFELVNRSSNRRSTSSASIVKVQLDGEEPKFFHHKRKACRYVGDEDLRRKLTHKPLEFEGGTIHLIEFKQPHPFKVKMDLILEFDGKLDEVEQLRYAYTGCSRSLHELAQKHGNSFYKYDELVFDMMLTELTCGEEDEEDFKLMDKLEREYKIGSTVDYLFGPKETFKDLNVPDLIERVWLNKSSLSW